MFRRFLHPVTCLIMCWMVTIAGGLTDGVHNAAASAPSALPSQGWSLDTPLPQKRVDVVAVRGDGMIYAFGVSPTVDAYHPSTHRWTVRASLPVTAGPAGRATAVAGSDGTVYVIVGTTLEAYDPMTNRWTTRAPVPVARFDAAAVTGRDGKIYVLGGYRPDPAEGDTVLYPRGLDVYDPKTNSWQVKAAMPTARQGLGAAVGPDGTLYAIGGGVYHDKHVTCLAVVEAYDPGTDVWSRKPSLPAPTCSVTAGSTLHGAIDAIGGSTVQAGEEGAHITSLTGTLLTLNPRTQHWTVISRTPYLRKRAGAVIEPDGTVYVIGGADRFGHATATVQKCARCTTN